MNGSSCDCSEYRARYSREGTVTVPSAQDAGPMHAGDEPLFGEVISPRSHHTWPCNRNRTYRTSSSYEIPGGAICALEAPTAYVAEERGERPYAPYCSIFQSGHTCSESKYSIQQVFYSTSSSMNFCKNASIPNSCRLEPTPTGK